MSTNKITPAEAFEHYYNLGVKRNILMWLEYPHLFKQSLKKTVESGVAFQFLDDPQVEEEVKSQLRELLPKLMSTADFKKLMKVYKSKILAAVPSKLNMSVWQNQFVRIAPSKRKL